MGVFCLGAIKFHSCHCIEMGMLSLTCVLSYGSAPFVIVNININRKVENSDEVQKCGGNMEGAWQERDGTDGQTDDYKVSNRT